MTSIFEDRHDNDMNRRPYMDRMSPTDRYRFEDERDAYGARDVIRMPRGYRDEAYAVNGYANAYNNAYNRGRDGGFGRFLSERERQYLAERPYTDRPYGHYATYGGMDAQQTSPSSVRPSERYVHELERERDMWRDAVISRQHGFDRTREGAWIGPRDMNDRMPISLHEIRAMAQHPSASNLLNTLQSNPVSDEILVDRLRDILWEAAAVASRNRPLNMRRSHSGRGPKGYRRADERVQEDVCEMLTQDRQLDASDISVRVSSGVVTLEGEVNTRQDKRVAEYLAESISGVEDVQNTLRVRHRGDFEAEVLDIDDDKTAGKPNGRRRA